MMNFVRASIRMSFLPVFLAVGCTTPSSSPSATSEEQLALNPFDRVGSRPEILNTAQLTGRLSSNGRCVTVETPTGAATPLWPEGTVLRQEAGRTLVVLPDGRGSAVLGGKVKLAGGSFAASQLEALPGWVKGSCPNNYFTVSNVD